MNGYYVYENPYALPVAYRVDKDFELALEKMEFFKNNQFFSSYNTNLLDCMLGESSNVLTILSYKFNKGELKSAAVDNEGGRDFRSPDDTKPCSFYYEVTAKKDGNVYMRLLSPYTTATKVYLNDSKDPLTTNYFKDKDKSFMNLGYYKAGDTIKVELEFTWYRLYIWNTKDFFFQIDDKALKAATDTLRDEGLRVSEHSDTYISGTLYSKDDGPVFTTIPYDSNWKVYVDGERVETYKMIDTMLGFDVTEGKHTIELEYVHTPFLIGTIISIIGIDLLVILWILEKKFRFRIIPFKKMAPVIQENDQENTEQDAQAIESSNDQPLGTNETQKISEENNDLPS